MSSPRPLRRCIGASADSDRPSRKALTNVSFDAPTFPMVAAAVALEGLKGTEYTEAIVLP
jgi:hypothetical protein